MRYAYFILTFTRSILCVLITSIKNIYDSRNKNIFELPPTNEQDIKDLSKALRNPTAFKYFEKYIESKYVKINQTYTEYVENTFNFRFLELYMDLREYYNIMTKLQENSDQHGLRNQDSIASMAESIIEQQ